MDVVGVRVGLDPCVEEGVWVRVPEEDFDGVPVIVLEGVADGVRVFEFVLEGVVVRVEVFEGV